ncbi:hypothetical protein [Streptomyces collinus]|uniref:hypothetical protein n=1 Tax=Streptomyces collinus TaxID=42684 RepID=UPI0033EBADC7
MPTSKFPSVRAFDQLLDGLGAGSARRRQLDMVRGELERALNRGALPVGARRSLQRLLEEEALAPHVPIAESGALRHRRVDHGRVMRLTWGLSKFIAVRRPRRGLRGSCRHDPQGEL